MDTRMSSATCRASFPDCIQFFGALERGLQQSFPPGTSFRSAEAQEADYKIACSDEKPAVLHSASSIHTDIVARGYYTLQSSACRMLQLPQSYINATVCRGRLCPWLSKQSMANRSPRCSGLTLAVFAQTLGPVQRSAPPSESPASTNLGRCLLPFWNLKTHWLVNIGGAHLNHIKQ